MTRYRIVTVHGEGDSLFHIVDTYQPESEQPAIVTTVRNRFVAEDEMALLESQSH